MSSGAGSRMTASAISSGHGTRRNFVSVCCRFELLISESASPEEGDGDREVVRDALVCEDVET